MDYREYPAPDELSGLIKLGWHLRMPGNDAAASDDAMLEQVVTPDGCMELIWRSRGRTFWHREQPQRFVAGLIGKPIRLQFSADVECWGLRLWPWTWAALGGLPAQRFLDDWLPFEISGLSAVTCARLENPEIPNWAFWRLLLADAASDQMADARRLGRVILQSGSVAAIVAGSGLGQRSLQRWFAQTVGIPPRSYLRMLRFQDSLQSLQADDASVAAVAAAAGYADQAHMARDFRVLAGRQAKQLRRRAKGPFLA